MSQKGCVPRSVQHRGLGTSKCFTRRPFRVSRGEPARRVARGVSLECRRFARPGVDFHLALDSERAVRNQPQILHKCITLCRCQSIPFASTWHISECYAGAIGHLKLAAGKPSDGWARILGEPQRRVIMFCTIARLSDRKPNI